MEKLLTRIAVNDGNRNIFAAIVSDKIKAATAQITELESAIDGFQKLIDLMEAYVDTGPDGDSQRPVVGTFHLDALWKNRIYP